MVDESRLVVPGRITVPQAAERLAVTQDMVRRLISSGDLPAERIGRAWMVSLEAVDLRLEQRPGDGRRLRAANAWAILFMAVGEPAPWLDQPSRWRLRRYLASHRLSDDRSRFAERGRPTAYRAHPSLLAAVRSDPALMLTGTSGASERRLGLIGGSGEVDAYAAIDDLDAIVLRHHLRPSGDPNVVLRVVPRFTTPWPPARVAPASAIALDLLDSPEPRAKQVGEEVLRGIERANAPDHADQ